MHGELEKLRIDKNLKAKRHTKPVWPWVILIILLLGGAVVLSQWRTASAAPLVQTIQVRLPEASAASDDDLVLLNATGYVIAAHKIELAARVIGRVAWIGVEMADKVTKGQVLVQLEDEDYKAHVAQQQGQLDNAKAKLMQTEADWKRAENLGPSEALAQQQYDQYKADYAAAKANVAVAQAQLDLAALDLKDTTIRAPLDATVLDRNVEIGEFVTNGFVAEGGSKGYVVSLADLNDLRVDLDISQNDFAKISAHQSCWITTDAYPDRKYAGTVDLISPEANRQKATVLVRVRVTKPDELLKPDMNATVSFLAPKKSGAATSPSERPAVRVPASAVKDKAVFVVESGKAVKRAVTIGSTSAKGEIEIRSGLIGGEDLIVSPPPTLNDGDNVKVPDAAK